MRNTLLLLTIFVPFIASAQTAQVGADREARGQERVAVEYIHYRPAKWETEAITEFESEHPNEGGLIYAYLRNISADPIDLRFWRVNNNDESYYRLNHFIAWDRVYSKHLEPDQSTVLEINALTDEFKPGERFSLSYVDGDYRPCLHAETMLNPDPVRIAYIRVREDLRTLDVHVRHDGKGEATLTGLEVVDHETAGATIHGESLQGPDNAVVTLTLAQPLTPGELIIVKANLNENGADRSVYAHRRAHADYFPIGVWHSNPESYQELDRIHIDTMVAGGGPDDPFYTVGAPQYGFRNMVHTGVPTNPDRVRAVRDKKSIACWMIMDEPDWSIPANIMLHEDTNLRNFDLSHPTFITLCRNTQFFAYAPIADIPCQDHYSVTAPSSSKWPKLYGTRLEETAYYTRDLKEASEPKPIWIWTQGIADWGQRPKRPVPTPSELAAQLILNIGRGAKGILWFNYDRKVAEKYPDAVDAMGEWGRVMRVLREDLLAGDIANANVKAPRKVDVAPIVTADKLILCITNTDYEIDPEAYPFKEKKDQGLRVTLPDWIDPKDALRVAPDGITPVEMERDGTDLLLNYGDLLDVAVLVISNDPATRAAYQTEYEAALADESGQR